MQTNCKQIVHILGKEGKFSPLQEGCDDHQKNNKSQKKIQQQIDKTGWGGFLEKFQTAFNFSTFWNNYAEFCLPFLANTDLKI